MPARVLNQGGHAGNAHPPPFQLKHKMLKFKYLFHILTGSQSYLRVHQCFIIPG